MASARQSMPYVPAGQTGGGQLASVDGPFSNGTITFAYDSLGRVNSRSMACPWGRSYNLHLETTAALC